MTAPMQPAIHPADAVIAEAEAIVAAAYGAEVLGDE